MCALSEVAVDEKEKDREEQDKLGPLRPLTPSKSAPVMATVMREFVERAASVDSTAVQSDRNVHKSASATPLSLVVKSPPTVGTEGLCNSLHGDIGGVMYGAGAFYSLCTF